MSTIELTTTQRFILDAAIQHTGGRIERFPDNIKGGARGKVLDGLFNRALITRDGEGWCVAAEGYDAMNCPRPGINRFGRGYPSGNFQTRHGWLGVTVVTPAQWVAFCKMLDMPELGADPKYSATIGRFNHADELKAIITPALLKKTALEWFEMGIELRLPLAVVPDMKELLEQDVHRVRGAFGTVEIGSVEPHLFVEAAQPLLQSPQRHCG